MKKIAILLIILTFSGILYAQKSVPFFTTNQEFENSPQPALLHLFFVGAITFSMMMFFQKTIQRKVIYNPTIFLLAVFIYPFFLINASEVQKAVFAIALTCVPLSISFIISYVLLIRKNRIENKTARRLLTILFIGLNLLLSSLCYLVIFKIPSGFIACNTGLIAGLSTFYFWKFLQSRNIKKKAREVHGRMVEARKKSGCYSR
jgi:hypothetical protein